MGALDVRQDLAQRHVDERARRESARPRRRRDRRPRAPRHGRCGRSAGAFASATATITSGMLVPKADDQQQHEDHARERQHDVARAHQPAVERAAAVGRAEPDGEPDRDSPGSVARTARMSAVRPPQRKRLSTSRPRKSSPKGWSGARRLRRRDRSSRRDRRARRTGPPAPITMITTARTMPTFAAAEKRRWRRAARRGASISAGPARRSLARPQAWREHDRGDVREQVPDHVDGGQDQRHGLHHRHVARGDGVDQEAARCPG